MKQLLLANPFFVIKKRAKKTAKPYHTARWTDLATATHNKIMRGKKILRGNLTTLRGQNPNVNILKQTYFYKNILQYSEEKFHILKDI